MKSKSFLKSTSKFVRRGFTPRLEPLFRKAAGDQERIQKSAQLFQDKPDMLSEYLVPQLLDDVTFNFVFRQGEKNRIPLSGPLIIVVNRPLAATDLLLFHQLISQVRPDTKIFRHRLLKPFMGLDRIQVCPDHKRSKRTNESEGVADAAIRCQSPREHLAKGGVVLFSPSKFLSRLGLSGLRDGRWSSRFLKLARQTKAPIQAMHIDTGGVFSVYRQSMAEKMLPEKLVERAHGSLDSTKVVVKVGWPVAARAYVALNLSNRAMTKLFRAEVYRLAKDKSSAFKQGESNQTMITKTERLKSAIQRCEYLDSVSDMQVILYKTESGEELLEEIGRLREVTFSAIGEGTGQQVDIDQFDSDYDHIVLWDDSASRVAGAYRLRPTTSIDVAQLCDRSSQSSGLIDAPSLYTQTLFDFLPSSEKVLSEGLELGRSFVHPDYWGSRSLDYLWMGIAAYLRKRPYYRYLFGAVSISNDMSDEAKDALVYYYRHFYGSESSAVNSHQPYLINAKHLDKFESLMGDLEVGAAFVELKRHLASLGESVPMLYKQYTSLCGPGGVTFHGFSVDPNFSDCIDGFVVVDIHELLPLKRKRYNLEGYPEAFLEQRRHA